MASPELRTERLLLRRWRDDDHEPFAAINADSRVEHFPDVLTRDQSDALGYATEGAQAALAFGFDVQRLPEIVSFTVPNNLRSRRVMEKIGMIYDPRDDFEHPLLPAGHPLQPHVLYRAVRR